jgi:cytochrome c oxidase subunit 3
LVTSTAAAPSFESSKVHSLTRPNIVSVGTIVWLSSELMFFAGLFAMYFTVRSVHPGDWPMRLPLDGGVHAGGDIKLSLSYATPFTVILVASSFTCQWGVFAAEKGDVFKLRRWFTLTFFLGLLFGLIAFILFLIRTTLGKFTPAQATAAIVVSYYWHFVDVVWIGLFAMIYIIR